MKKGVVAAVWLIAIAVWVGIAAFKVFADPTLKEWTIAVTAGALTLEAAFWVTAAILGITILQSRKAVIGFIARPFRRKR
ncbi:MAG: hypothetical protein ACOZAA_07165 [Pseudomonadota bacterium]